MDLLKNLGLFTVGTISIAGAVVFITKFLITKVFDGILETYKTSLNKEIESFKMNLQKQFYEHNVTFNKLHIERAEVIKSLYAKLADMQDELSLYNKIVVSNGKIDDISENLKSCVGDFMTYANHNRIYFDDDTCFIIKEIESIIMIIFSFLYNDGEDRKPVNTVEHKDFIGSLVDKEIPKFQTLLEKQFKSILRVHS